MAKKLINVSGVSERASAPILASIGAKEEEQNLVIVSGGKRAEILAKDLSFFTNRPIYVLPSEDYVFLKYDARSNENLIERLRVLKALQKGEPCFVIAPVSAAIKKLIPHKEFENKSLTLERGKDIDIDFLKETLVSLGYERRQLVDGKGQFSIRGGIIDIFTADGEEPFRVELFDTEIDSIRTFDVDTQRSIENLRSVEVHPAQQLIINEKLFDKAGKNIEEAYSQAIKKMTIKNPQVAQTLEERKNQLLDYTENCSNIQLLENYIHYFYSETEYIWDYMHQGNIIVEDPDRVVEVLNLRDSDFQSDSQVMVERGELIGKDLEIFSTKEDFLKVYREDKVWVLTAFPKRVEGVTEFTNIQNLQSRNVIAFNSHMDLFESEIKAYVSKGYQIHIVCSTEGRLEGLKEYISNLNVPGKYHYHIGEMSGGFDFPNEKVCYITEKDVFSYSKSQKRKKKRKEFTNGQKIQSFSDLSEGDYVVHENHGIGRFIKIEQLSVQGEVKDYLQIKYAGNDMLYVPVEQMDIVQKYIGSEGNPPKIHKLSGGEWKITKAKAKEAIAEIAEDLIKLYATRKMNPGYAFKEDDQWQREFEESFPYAETDDQLRSIAEIKEDMEKPIAMDRLLCGDVGFGKTEVAARAIFKCLAEGKQVAFLVPTTILANQHYYTLRERLEKFPFTVEMLSRFRTDKEQRETVEKLAKGKVDLVIGTHRLLSQDIKFKDLGLLVIDEEQRFGVSHKEAIKKLREDVDVLTLSATPIPRTLNMSLTGIKDMSLIEEPPEERYPVQTYVLEQSEELIRDVIKREIGRGGQVFVVYNRVRGIQKVAGLIEDLVPEANVAVGHGQMNESTLENIMIDFINGQYNVLVATTIIESGIDIPNANTMVILNADHFGLSQLYQLRGRVGRSNRVAYAYLMYQKDKVLTETAEKRLKAIKDFTEFGGGFKVAMKDLEIRGAGNLLGSQQSGHIMNIGYELYCKMVDEAVRELQGEKVIETTEEISIEFPKSAYIPEWYIRDPSLKLQMYKKIAGIVSLEEEDDICDELLDRFGDIPKETIRLIKISRIRHLASQIGMERVYPQTGKVVLEFRENNNLNAFSLMSLTSKYGQRIFVHAGKKPMIRISSEAKKQLQDTIDILEVLVENQKSS